MQITNIYDSESDKLIEKKINTYCNYITEVFHELIDADVVIKGIIRHIQDNHQKFEDFYTGYVWNSIEHKFIFHKDLPVVRIDEYPVWIKYTYIDSFTYA